jgi:hypothetical protein
MVPADSARIHDVNLRGRRRIGKMTAIRTAEWMYNNPAGSLLIFAESYFLTSTAAGCVTRTIANAAAVLSTLDLIHDRRQSFERSNNILPSDSF